jgi:hypothetical protein
MLEKRKFNIVVVGESLARGMDEINKYDKVVDYTGRKVIIKF